jgi:hypothetical protein
MKRRGGPSVGKAVDLFRSVSRVPGRTPEHLDGIQRRNPSRERSQCPVSGSEGKIGIRSVGLSDEQIQPYRIVMLAPEAVLAVAKTVQRYGLAAPTKGRDERMLNRETLWRIPPSMQAQAILLPQRR